MEEIVKYFQNIEARLAALEAAEQAEPAQNALIAELQAQIAGLRNQVAALQEQVTELQNRPATVVAAAPAEPSLSESETIAIDAETGLPEMEVELVDEPETPDFPAASEKAKAEDPLLAAVIEKVQPANAAPAAAPKAEETKAAEAPAAATAAPAATIGAAVKEAVSSVIPKLEDIRKGITMGDRFLFQRELFAGDGELMQKTIAALNSLGSLQEAEAYIEKNFKWNKDSNAYELFHDLLKRRW